MNFLITLKILLTVMFLYTSAFMRINNAFLNSLKYNRNKLFNSESSNSLDNDLIISLSSKSIDLLETASVAVKGRDLLV